MGPIRVVVDNPERSIQILDPSGTWIELEPFHVTLQTCELPGLFLAVQERDRIPREMLAAYDYEGRCLWSLGAEELPLHHARGGMYVSRTGDSMELHLNRGNAYCVITDVQEPTFGEPRER